MCDFKVVRRCDFKQSLCGPVSLHQAVTFSFHWFFRQLLRCSCKTEKEKAATLTLADRDKCLFSTIGYSWPDSG